MHPLEGGEPLPCGASFRCQETVASRAFQADSSVCRWICCLWLIGDIPVPDQGDPLFLGETPVVILGGPRPIIYVLGTLCPAPE